MVINLSQELKNAVKSGHVKTVDIVRYILDTIPNTETDKWIMETTLKDISFNGIYPKSGKFDTWTGQLMLYF